MPGLIVATRQAATNHFLGKTAWTKPTAVYLALFTADPGDTGSVTSEVAGGGYARVEITSKMSSADAAGISTNASLIAFAAPSANWGSIAWLGLMSAATGGAMLGRIAPTEVQEVVSGGPAYQIPIGTLNVTFE